MAVINTNLVCDLQKAVKVEYIDGVLFSQDNQANKINVTVLDGGEPATISGTVSANIIRSDGGTVAATGGSITGNVASITLPAAAYAVPGVVSIVVKLTASGVITTIAAIVGNMYRSSTDTAIDPGTVIPSIQTLISQINTAVASIPADYSSLWTKLAPAFSTSASYVAGQYVTYNSGLYRFNTTHTGDWSSSDVTAVNLGGEISDLKSASTLQGDELLDLTTIDKTNLESGIWENNGTKSSDATRVRMIEPVFVHEGTKIQVVIGSGYMTSYKQFLSDPSSSGSTLIDSDGSWVGGDRTITIKKQGWIVFNFKASTGTAAFPLSSFAGFLRLYIESVITTPSEYIEEYKINSLIELELGTLDSSGSDEASTYRLRTKMIQFPYPVQIETIGDYQVAKHPFYDNVKQAQTGWLTSCILSPNVKHRLVFRKSNNATLTTQPWNNVFNAYKVSTDELQGTFGDLTYSGDKINLNINRYDAFKLGMTIPNINDSIQDCAIYNGVMFQLYNPNICATVDMSTGTEISRFEIQCGHGNTASFTGFKYDSSDEFPLLMCGEWESNTCKVYINRVTRTSSTLIQTITLDTDVTGYYAGFAYYKNGIFYTVGYSNDDYLQGDHTIICKWILDSNFQNDPAFLGTYNVDFIAIRQGITIVKDYLVIASGMPSYYVANKITFVDLNASFMCSVIDKLPTEFNSAEIEGIDSEKNTISYDLVVTANTRSVYRLFI